MKVILTEKVATLGTVGEVVTVSAGYARNFLIPFDKAVAVNEGRLRELNAHKKALGKKIEEEKKAAMEVKEKLDGLVLEIYKKVGANGKLFGAVTAADLVKELKTKDLDVERRVLGLSGPIKSLGTFDVKVKLFAEVEGKFQVKVMIDPAQAEELKKQQELDEKKAKAKKEKAANESKEEVTEKADEPKKEEVLTEEQKLQREADGILRGY